MSGDKFKLDDYVDVATRITKFYEKYPDGSIQSEVFDLSDSRVIMRAYAYRTPDDPRPGIGHSMLGIPGATPYTRGSEVENAETSAVGRAIAMLGFEVKRGIASAQEIRNKSGSEAAPGDGEERLTSKGRVVRQGRVARGQGRHSDLMPRQMPDGYLVGFRLELPDGKSIPQVIATGAAGAWLFRHIDALMGAEVQVAGEAFEVSQPGRRPYGRLLVEAIEGPFGLYPDPDTTPEADDAQRGSVGLTEAESEAIWQELGV